MPGQFRVAFGNFPAMQFPNARRMQLPRRHPNLPAEETLIRTALDVGTISAAQRSFHRSVLHAADDPPASLTVSGAIPGARIRIPREWTVAEGVTVGAGAGVAGSVSGGVYYWIHSPHSELGLFGSISLGIISNVSAGAGVVCMILFGSAPSLFAGDTLTISVDIGLEFLTLAGFLILSAPPGGFGPPAGMPRAAGAITGAAIATAQGATVPSLYPGWTPEIIGLGFSMTAGWSALPVSFSVMPGRTWLRPVLT